MNTIGSGKGKIMARDKVIPVRLNSVELEAIRGAAQADERSLSEFIRRAVLRSIGVKPKKPKERR